MGAARVLDLESKNLRAFGAAEGNFQCGIVADNAQAGTWTGASCRSPQVHVCQRLVHNHLNRV
jgi:hypothetical protein